MKPILKRILLSLLISASSVVSLSAQDDLTYFLHTIEKGQSLYSIATMYGVSQDDLITLNPGSNEKIIAGQTLRIPQTKTNNVQQETFHTIQPGETLYSLTTKYNISAKDICEANPGLSAQNFRIGDVVRIPTASNTSDETAQQQAKSNIPGAVKSRCKDMHKVQRKETIFSVSRLYGISEEELYTANPELKNGLKRGQFICIPYPNAGQISVSQGNSSLIPPTNKELFKANKEVSKQYDTVKAALLLPFIRDKRMVEYYEGFLLAVDSLKRNGLSFDIYAFDVNDSEASLTTVLAKPEMKEMNLIIGPVQGKYTKKVAKFAKENDINMVVPFSSREEEVFSNPSVFQINTPQSYLYSEVYDHFTRQFTNANVILLDAGNEASKGKKEFIDGLKADLTQKNVSFKALPEGASVEGLKGAVVEGKQNVFIPTSGSDVTLIKIIPQLIMLVRENPELMVSLFGYPEWQTYTKDHLESFFELDTYFYSSFYTNNLLPTATNFISKYNRWYGKDMENNYPKYGMLGYDTGLFFLNGLSKYGTTFENNLEKINYRPIQTGFNFQRVNNWGGFINKKVFFVNFTKGYELVKLDFE